MRFFNYILTTSALMILTSCEKEIDFEYKDIPEQQVIEGLLTQEGISVRLTKTVPTDEPFNDNTVIDASVTVVDKTDGESYSLTPNEKGEFSHPGLIGETGHEYELIVNIGKDIYTSTSIMLPPSEIVSAEFNWIKMPYDDVAVLKVQFTELWDMNAQYWLRVYRNGESYEWQAIESRNAVDGLVIGMMMTSRKDIDEEDDDTVLKDGDVIDIEVLPISKVMGDYLNSLNNGDYNGNQMFTGSYCLGYFLVAPVSHASLIYHPDQIPYAE
ncbi:MAG: DUF4249 domain-containing protein [Pseudoflavonifractor sp.]|nr:DUF4249 domain-containing protein [Pseudoflavonifractor sp.]